MLDSTTHVKSTNPTSGIFPMLGVLILCGLLSIPAFADQTPVEVTIPAGSATPGCESTNECYIDAEVTIDAGSEVVWSNEDSASHTVTSGDPKNGQDGIFDSGLFLSGQTFSHTFEEEGEFPYFCLVHPWMQGTVIVGQGSSQEFDANSEPIIVVTDEDHYDAGDVVSIYGEVSERLSGYDVTLELFSANSNLVTRQQLPVLDDNTFELELIADGPLWRASGTYTVKVLYGTATRSAETTFEFSGSGNIPTPTQPTQPTQDLPSEATVLMAKGTAANTNCGDQCYAPNTVSVSAGGKVTWNNVDSAAHTATATDGSFDTSLVNAGASASNTFNTAGTYSYMCILHPWMKGVVFVGQGTPNPTPTPDIELFVDMDKSEYDLGELATLIIHISDVSSPQTVALTVTDPFGTVVVSRTLTTDPEGDASADFKISENFKTGTYRIDATSLIDGWTYLDDAEFEVISQFNQIQIVSAQGTDQQGNPMEFSRGNMGFVKVQVSAQKPIATLITVNVFDSDLTPLGVGSLKTTLNTGQSELILSFMIPEDAVVGTADIYVNALSDWVSAGGIPQTGEFAGQVRIN